MGDARIMCIREEFEKSKNYMLETVEDGNGEKLVALTRDNVARVEAMIRNDSTYSKTFDRTAKPEPSPLNRDGKCKYGGSTAYWVTQLKNVLREHKEKSADGYTFEEITEYLVAAIDRENSTHLNADGNGRAEICKRIVDSRDHLEDWLQNRNKKYEIIDCLRAKTSGKRGRENLSFASKFAHYAAFYAFEETEYQDGFSIYDGVLIRALPKYIEFYNSKAEDYIKNYKNYQDAIDSIRDAAEQQYGEKLSRNGLDHLLWYYHKGRP